jgi:hypothetical protein
MSAYGSLWLERFGLLIALAAALTRDGYFRLATDPCEGYSVIILNATGVAIMARVKPLDLY